MSHPTPTTTRTATPDADLTPARVRRRRALAALLPLAAFLAACAGADAAAPAHDQTAHDQTAHDRPAHDHHGHDMALNDRLSAMRATAAYQDVAVAEDGGWASTIDTLGCFQNPDLGGMGVHYVNQQLMDATVDMTKPEALVYELDAAGNVVGLVAHEYIVPVDAWTSKKPPRLFGMDFHRHPTLPLWVLHTWLWKDNPAGVFEDWNVAVRLCPAGVPIFGQDLPAPAPAS